MRKNPPLRTAILAAALVVFFALPSLASAGQVVPPGNSAATQYTQVFPTSGGNVEVGNTIGESGAGGGKKPSQVIGKKTAQELESQGAEGAAVAQLAAESAPEPVGEPEATEGSSANAGGGSSSGHHDGGNAGGGQKSDGNGAKAGGGGQDTGPAAASPGSGGAQTAQTAQTAASTAADSGSSGLSEVLGQATSGSSGQMGLFLPLVLLAALVLALVYAWRRRHHEPGTLP